MLALTIGQLAAEAGCAVQTIRHYEQIGLLPAAARSAGNQRRYGRTHRERLAFIRHARDLGLSLDEIRDLLRIGETADGPCTDADAIIRGHLATVTARIAQLEALRREFERMLGECHGGTVSDCRVLGILADHAQCLAPDHAPQGDGQEMPPAFSR